MKVRGGAATARRRASDDLGRVSSRSMDDLAAISPDEGKDGVLRTVAPSPSQSQRRSISRRCCAAAEVVSWALDLTLARYYSDLTFRFAPVVTAHHHTHAHAHSQQPWVESAAAKKALGKSAAGVAAASGDASAKAVAVAATRFHLPLERHWAMACPLLCLGQCGAAAAPTVTPRALAARGLELGCAPSELAPRGELYAVAATLDKDAEAYHLVVEVRERLRGT